MRGRGKAQQWVQKLNAKRMLIDWYANWMLKMASSSCTRLFFFFQAEDGIRDLTVTGVQTCALPISTREAERPAPGIWVPGTCPRVLHRGHRDCTKGRPGPLRALDASGRASQDRHRSEEHTSELQSQSNLVCRLLLEKKKNRSDLSNAGANFYHLRNCPVRLCQPRLEPSAHLSLVRVPC